MFARPLRERRIYVLTDRNGGRLNSDIYGLRGNVNYYLEDFYAVRLPRSLVAPIDRPAAIPPVLQHIWATGKARKAAFPLTLTMQVVGPTETSAVGVVATKQWHISE